ncbi:MAG: NAD(P)/FAD-dependent oxidoreductase [Gammaproteobacteria bacterium]|nr:NAD(P)/FAD-dependent oxidoreductase [Gammaproteobacteria bacterium]
MAEPGTEQDVFKIVVVGGGAGGLELVTELGKRYRRDDSVSVTLIDATSSHLWKPLLHEVAAGTLNSNDDELSYLAQGHWNHFTFRLGALESIDRAAKTLAISPSYDAEGREYIPRRELSYDTLVISVGSLTNDFGIEGVREHCMFLDSREQADLFHKRLVRDCYTANTQEAPLREGQLHVAIAGAGATGVELAAELHDSIRELVSYGLERIDPQRDVRIHIVEASEKILPSLPDRISERTTAALEAMGVVLHTGEFVTRATADAFETKSGKRIPAEIKVWAAGIGGPDVLAGLDGLETNRINQLVVRGTLQTTQDDDIFALGDCAACPIENSYENTVPPRAQAAHQQATHVAEAIKALREGRTVGEFSYNDYGSLINLSQRGTVGTLMGNLLGKRAGRLSVEGLMARTMYKSLYKMHQVAVQGWLRTTLLTVANALTHRSKPRMKLH